MAARQPPNGWAGSGASLGPPGPAPPAGGTTPLGPRRGAAGARSPRGAQIFGRGAEEKGFVSHSRVFVNIWPATRVVKPSSGLEFLGALFPFCKGLP